MDEMAHVVLFGELNPVLAIFIQCLLSVLEAMSQSRHGHADEQLVGQKRGSVERKIAVLYCPNLNCGQFTNKPSVYK